ncbi:MAG: ABC transporter permease subunit [Gemmataceae bacterium]|nr:ABC transporter permease subunit [Gemmataceae bacterium]
MRWPIIRLICLRELRDQLRDRRTLFMIVGLPLLLYPVLGFVVLEFAIGFVQRPIAIGVVAGPFKGAGDFPPRAPAALQSALVIPPVGPAGSGLRADYLAGVAALAYHPALTYPPLIEGGRFASAEGLPPAALELLRPVLARLHVESLTEAEAEHALQQKRVDVVLSVSPDFWHTLGQEGVNRSALYIQTRKGDQTSALAVQRLAAVLHLWKRDFKGVHLVRRGLPADFDEPFRDVQAGESGAGPGSPDSMLKLMVRIFPFMLVMWSLAGALYPAVDVCAGEKERGTMETLLISPAARQEIVWGKFLTIWILSGASALLNLFSMGLTTWLFSDRLPQGGVTPGALFWCVLLVVPLSAFFSAVCLAIGAYARSSKEGQYYLLPLFLITMPLIFLTLAPGVVLNPFYSMVPVTGVVLLMQGLMTGEADWFYLLPVLAPVMLYTWLALRWAIDQFHREEVLFREAERLDLRLWLRRLFREKEALPTAGQALFCFALLLGLLWLSAGLGHQVPLLARRGIVLAAFVAAPPLFMALLLTRRPWKGLALTLPAPGYLLVALLLLPLADLGSDLLARLPALSGLVFDRQELVRAAFALDTGPGGVTSWGPVLLLALLSAVSKELAFRGLILTGLRQRFSPWAAILISSLLFAAFHMNVFVMGPAFVLGVVLGVLAVRSGSIVPGVLLHAGCYALLLGGDEGGLLPGWGLAGRLALAGASAAAALLLLWQLNRRSGGRGWEALVGFPGEIRNQ